MTKSHYEVIGVGPDATATQIRQAYLARARALHPDQFAGRPAAERARAERRMQDLNAAWNVLSNTEAKRAYDASRGRRVSGTDPLVSARSTAWKPFDASSSPTPPRPRRPQMATEEEMEIRGPARLLRPIPLLLMVGTVVALILVGTVLSGGDSDGPTRARGEPVVQPTGVPIGCIDLTPVVAPVPCGGHDATVWKIVDAGESCGAGLDPIYRQSAGGLFCVTRES